MAARATVLGSVPALPTPAEALAQLRAVIARLDHRTLAEIATAAIDRLDEIDGDPDLEPNGDEQDGTRAEDEPYFGHGFGPGCTISDPDCGRDGS